MFGIGQFVDDLIDNPVATVVNTATQPLRDGLEIVDGALEGELREKAALRLGADVVAGMALSEVVSFLLED